MKCLRYVSTNELKYWMSISGNFGMSLVLDSTLNPFYFRYFVQVTAIKSADISGRQYYELQLKERELIHKRNRYLNRDLNSDFKSGSNNE